MNRWGSLERFLRTDPPDAGCAETFKLLDCICGTSAR